MSNSEENPIIPDPNLPPVEGAEETDGSEARRRLLLILQMFLLLGIIAAVALFIRYILAPAPITQLILPPQVAANACYQPSYKYSINDVNGPVSVAVSPDNQRIYVAEGHGDRLIKIFDRDGKQISSFAPPGTDKSSREPKYMAIGADGRVYVVDQTSHAIDIYDQDGNFVDAIIGQHLTLSKFITSQVGSITAGTTITHYDGLNQTLSFNVPDQGVKTLKVTFDDKETTGFSPLGLRFDTKGNLLYTDITENAHSIQLIPAEALAAPLSAYNPQMQGFGNPGNGDGNDQFSFPQTAVVDTKGNYYISDGNKARIEVWTADMKYKTFFGFGSDVPGTLNLPRGAWMVKDCLLVADAVGSMIRVYNVGGTEPSLSAEIGMAGTAEGEFNYPIDVTVDGTGRLYVADRANNRVQVWSY